MPKKWTVTLTNLSYNTGDVNDGCWLQLGFCYCSTNSLIHQKGALDIYIYIHTHKSIHTLFVADRPHMSPSSMGLLPKVKSGTENPDLMPTFKISSRSMYCLVTVWTCQDPNTKKAFCWIFYVFGSCFRTLAVILVSDSFFKLLFYFLWTCQGKGIWHSRYTGRQTQQIYWQANLPSQVACV